MSRGSDVRAVQHRLQELLDDLPEEQAALLEAVVARPPTQVLETIDDPGPDGDEVSIIIVSGRGRRWLRFDLDDILAELNPQPLPPEPPDLSGPLSGPR